MDDTDDMSFFFSIDAQSNDIVVRKMHDTYDMSFFLIQMFSPMTIEVRKMHDTDGMSFVFYIDALHIYIYINDN